MNRSQLYTEAKALGLNVEWKTSTIARLQQAIREQRARLARPLRTRAALRELNLGPDASFEEHFAHMRTVALIDSLELTNDAFMRRLNAARDYLTMQGTPHTPEATLAAGVLLVGADYSVSHPLNPQESVERLRTAKRAALLAQPSRARTWVLEYISRWEAVLTSDEIALYL